MKTQVIMIDRRQHQREGVFGELESLTYVILRRYGIGGRSENGSASQKGAKAA